MHVAEVSKYFYPYAGGLESNVLDLVKWLTRKGVDVSCITSLEPDTKTRGVLHGANVFRSRIVFTLFNAPFNPGTLPNLIRSEYDLIHLHLPDPFNSIFACIAARVKNKPLVVTYHADIIKDRWYHLPFRLVYSFFLRRVLKQARVIIATSRDYAEYSSALEGFRDKICVVPNYVDAHRFTPDTDGTVIKERHSIEDKKVILFVGRLVPYKGVEYLIKAFNGIKKHVSDTALLIVGDDLLRNDLEKLASSLNLEDVLFTGKVSNNDLPAYYAACNVFVLPSISRQEAFGISLIEAMASGKAVVGTNIKGSGVPYVIGDCGITVEPKSVGDLEEGVVKILNDNRLAQELGKRGRERVEKEFSIDSACKRIFDIFESVYQGPGGQ